MARLSGRRVSGTAYGPSPGFSAVSRIKPANVCIDLSFTTYGAPVDRVAAADLCRNDDCQLDEVASDRGPRRLLLFAVIVGSLINVPVKRLSQRRRLDPRQGQTRIVSLK